MFGSLSTRLNQILGKLRQRGVLTETDVNDALREIRVALLEADVALPVARQFIEIVRERAVGQEVLSSITPGQMVVKIVHQALLDILSPSDDQNTNLNLATKPPAKIVVAGLQGSGKTTTAAKIGRLLHAQGKRVLLVSLDIYRPAAQQQLATLGEKLGLANLPIVSGQQPLEIVERALKECQKAAHDVVIFDTAGRLHVDEELMEELRQIVRRVEPQETLFVADALTGQDAVNTATAFKEAVPLTGVVLTRVDGDSRGGAALSVRMITGCPIKFLGVGEKPEQLESFDAKRLADRILDMGDVVGLVEKMTATFDQEQAQKMADKMATGQFDLNDMAEQLQSVNKMGGMGQIMGMLPGMGQLAAQAQMAGKGDQMVKRSVAIIRSMTPQERRQPNILNASRRRRIANGSGVTVADVNRLMKQYQDMADMMKRVKKLGMKNMLRHGFKGLFKSMILYGTLISLGQAQEAPNSLQIDAQSLELNQNDKQVVASGDAVAHQGEVKLHADKLIAHYRQKPSASKTSKGGQEIWRIEAQGHVEIHRPQQKAFAEHAMYNLDEDMVRLTGQGLRVETPDATLCAEEALEFWQGKRLGLAKGNAKVQLKNQRQVTADTLTAHFTPDPKQKKKLQLDRVIGGPKVVVTTLTERIEGNQGIYDAKRELVTLTGDVHITRGTSELSGDRAEVNLRTGISRLLSAPNRKVKAKLIPDQALKKRAQDNTLNGSKPQD